MRNYFLLLLLSFSLYGERMGDSTLIIPSSSDGKATIKVGGHGAYIQHIDRPAGQTDVWRVSPDGTATYDFLVTGTPPGWSNVVNLSTEASETAVTVHSSTETNSGVTLPSATSTAAGVITATDKSKLDSLTALPTQTGQSGKVLGTDGSTASWVVQSGGGGDELAEALAKAGTYGGKVSRTFGTANTNETGEAVVSTNNTPSFGVTDFLIVDKDGDDRFIDSVRAGDFIDIVVGTKRIIAEIAGVADQPDDVNVRLFWYKTPLYSIGLDQYRQIGTGAGTIQFSRDALADMSEREETESNFVHYVPERSRAGGYWVSPAGTGATTAGYILLANSSNTQIGNDTSPPNLDNVANITLHNKAGYQNGLPNDPSDGNTANLDFVDKDDPMVVGSVVCVELINDDDDVTVNQSAIFTVTAINGDRWTLNKEWSNAYNGNASQNYAAFWLRITLVPAPLQLPHAGGGLVLVGNGTGSRATFQELLDLITIPVIDKVLGPREDQILPSITLTGTGFTGKTNAVQLLGRDVQGRINQVVFGNLDSDNVAKIEEHLHPRTKFTISYGTNKEIVLETVTQPTKATLVGNKLYYFTTKVLSSTDTITSSVPAVNTTFTITVHGTHVDRQELSTVAFSGSYNDLLDKPSGGSAYDPPALFTFVKASTGLSVNNSGSYIELINLYEWVAYSAIYVPKDWTSGNKLTVRIPVKIDGASSGEKYRLEIAASRWKFPSSYAQPGTYLHYTSDQTITGSTDHRFVEFELITSDGSIFGLGASQGADVAAETEIGIRVKLTTGTSNSISSSDNAIFPSSIIGYWDTSSGAGGSNQGAQGLNPSQGGDITGVTAGKGMIGGGLTGNVTLNVVGGDGIEVGDDKVSAKLDGATLTAGASGLSVTNPFTAADETKLDGLTNVVANPNESVGGGDLTKLKVGSSVFSVPHLSVSAVGEDVSGETFVDVSSKTYSDNDVLVISVMELAGNGRVWSVILRFADILTTKMWIGTGYQGARFMIRRNNSKLQWSEGGAINADNKILVYKLSI